MANLTGLMKLFKESTFYNDRDFEWDGYNEGEYKYVPQGSYLGSTLIMFADDYEHAGEDAKLISEMLRWLAAQVTLDE